MIRFQSVIQNISDCQDGELPHSAQKLDMPPDDKLMKKAAPIAACLCAVMFVSMFLKTFFNKSLVIHPVGVLIGAAAGFLLLIVHECLHAVVYPGKACVTVGRLKGKFVFVALASFPLRRSRFVLMCLLPFVLGIVPLSLFILSPAENRLFNGIMFGAACLGMVSPFPDVYNVIRVLKQTKSSVSIMFHNDSVYRIPSE